LLYTTGIIITGIIITVRTVAASAPVRVQANQTRTMAIQTILIKDLKSQVMATEYPKAAINVNR
jgi:ribonuclease PH